MNSTERRYGKQEFARRGDEVYQSSVRPHLQAKDDGSYAAVDIDSGEYELAETEIDACDKLRARRPDAQIRLVRVGSAYLHRFGGRDNKVSVFRET